MKSNLPKEKPYQKFFGREDSINLINNKLLNRVGHIASIDGVGGIGKTALAYYFCETIVLKSLKFDYLIWISAKDSIFDVLVKTDAIKQIDNMFKINSIEYLIDETIKLLGFWEDFKDKNLLEKKDFFEKDILPTEKIFYVIDNLETIENKDFFKYIDKIAEYNNYNLKILTTSRTRDKSMTDNAIRIEEISEDESLHMLKYLAQNLVDKPILEILNATDYQNRQLVNRVGRIPLVITFIVGQLSLKNSKGDIYKQLEGYPDISNFIQKDKSKILSDIISFSFKNMYESLSVKHQEIFLTIAVWERNKRGKENNVSIDLLISLTNYSVSEIKDIIEDLINNQLIASCDDKKEEYIMKKMAINFSKQFYSDFDKFETRINQFKNMLDEKNIDYSSDNKIKWIITRVQQLIDDKDFDQAKKIINNVIGDDPYCADSRIHHLLANIYKALSQEKNSEDAFHDAISCNPNDKKIWWDWVDLYDKSKDKKINIPKAIEKAKEGLRYTKGDYSLITQLLNIYKYAHDVESFRDTIKNYIQFYESENKENVVKLLRIWKDFEYHKRTEDSSLYFNIIEKLIKYEEENESKLSLLKEELKVAKSINRSEKVSKVHIEISRVNHSMLNSIPSRLKELNKMHNQGEYDEVIKSAYKILNILNTTTHETYTNERLSTLRVLLQSFARNEKFKSITDVCKQYLNIINKDDDLKLIYRKALKRINHFEYFKLIQPECRRHIEDNNLKSIFHLLKDINSEIDNTVSLLQSRYNEIQKQQIITGYSQNNLVEVTKISKALLDLIDKNATTM